MEINMILDIIRLRQKSGPVIFGVNVKKMIYN